MSAVNLTPKADVAAVRLKVSVRTVERLMEAGKLGYVRIGSKRFCTDEQIDAFLQASTVEAAS